MKSIRSGMRAWLGAAAVLIIVVVAFRVVRSMRPVDPAIALRDTIAVLRASADSCLMAVDSGAARMRAYGRTIDSMRARVHELEALDQRGVPADSYRVYISTFHAYNDSVDEWPAREDSVRALDARCRDVANLHNELTDSLRTLILPGTSVPD